MCSCMECMKTGYNPPCKVHRPSLSNKWRRYWALRKLSKRLQNDIDRGKKEV